MHCRSLCTGTTRALGILLLVSLSPLAAPGTAHAASSWDPALIVNTEASQIIDDSDSEANVILQFGGSLQEKLTYNRSQSRFDLSRSALVGGNLTATGSLSIKQTMSGSALHVDNDATVGGDLTTTGTGTFGTGYIGDATDQLRQTFSPTDASGPAYTNPGGTGYRIHLITVTNLDGWPANPSRLVNGAIVNGENSWTGTTTTSGLVFDFGAGNSKIITEAKWYQSATNTHGDWKWQGSNNGSDWTDIGSSFTLGGATVQTQTELSGNTAGYRYYRLLGVSGSKSSGPWLQEIEFKIDDYGVNASLQTYANTTPTGILKLQPSGGPVYIGPLQFTAAGNLSTTGTFQLGGFLADVVSGVPTFFVDNVNHRVGVGLSTPTGALHSYSATLPQLIVSGWGYVQGAGTHNGAIRFGTTDAYYTRITYDTAGTNVWNFDHSYDNVGYSYTNFRFRTNGTPITTLQLRETGNVLMPNDNGKFYQGAGNDVSNYFNGSDWIFNSENITANDEVHFVGFNGVDFGSGFITTTGTGTFGTGLINNGVATPAASYINTGGQGSRTGTITITTNTSIYGTLSSLVNGVLDYPCGFYANADITNLYFRFDFGTAKLITEATFYEGWGTANYGTWKWQGSNDASSWTDIGNSFTWGGSARQVQTELSSNTNFYRYYQLLGVSGSIVSYGTTSAYLREFEFKIASNTTQFLDNGIAQVGKNFMVGDTEGAWSTDGFYTQKGSLYDSLGDTYLATSFKNLYLKTSAYGVISHQSTGHNFLDVNGNNNTSISPNYIAYPNTGLFGAINGGTTAGKFFIGTGNNQGGFTLHNQAGGFVNIGLAQITPTARFHLPAGTATADSAPLKFTAGTDLAAPEAGALEYSTGLLKLRADDFGLIADSKYIYFGAGSDTKIGYDGTYWDFDIAQATTSTRFNPSQIDTDFIVYGDTAAMMTLDAGDLSATFGGDITTTGTGTIGTLILGTLPPTYADNAAAVAGGLAAGQLYRSGGDPDVISIVH